jgi:hypothetical protein
MLNIVDEFTHECLTIRVARSLKCIDVIDTLSDLFILRSVPAHNRPTRAPNLSPKPCRTGWSSWAQRLPIARGSPWENGFIESFSARLRDEPLNRAVFYTLREAQIVIQSWRRHYNAVRPHASHPRCSSRSCSMAGYPMLGESGPNRRGSGAAARRHTRWCRSKGPSCGRPQAYDTPVSRSLRTQP